MKVKLTLFGEMEGWMNPEYLVNREDKYEHHYTVQRYLDQLEMLEMPLFPFEGAVVESVNAWQLRPFWYRYFQLILVVDIPEGQLGPFAKAANDFVWEKSPWVFAYVVDVMKGA